MGFSLSVSQADAVLHALKQEYRVYAPKRFPKHGRYSDTDIIRYTEVDAFSELYGTPNPIIRPRKSSPPFNKPFFISPRTNTVPARPKQSRFCCWPAPATSTPSEFRPAFTPVTAALTICITPGFGIW